MEVVIVAITYMKNGFCFAGISKDGNWVRPVLPNKGQWKSLYYENGRPICIGDVIEVNGRGRPYPPHTEDVEVKRFCKIRKMEHNELISFLTDNAENEPDLRNTLERNNRSLCIVNAQSFRKVYVDKYDKKKTRVSFVFNNKEYENTTLKKGFPCTCLHWRTIQSQALEYPKKFKKIFISIGLARGFTGDDGVWVHPAPMIISIITDPPLPGGINYLNP
ncbi:hypothetical protein JOC37_000268 [Desulfohalotomaculum tongense]|uniref:dual OB domain-containing protein n=1 Tax=Desulforadius tongensis TaxID=1216062 RepID=UPI00195B15AC|nr:hypothetical protein [Desulforadius tongensis]MBM7853903.1 hypothetical protein [Desulforadius tongensis]